MDMNSPSDSSSSSSTGMSSTGMMIPWLHFTGGDNLYFKSLRPSSKGAIAGACLVLILLALFERWVAAMRAVLEAYWRKRFVLVSVSVIHV
jgi:copper transporter 1